MCNFNAICCKCCEKDTNVDKDDPWLLTNSRIVTRSSEITINPVSNDIIMSMSSSRSSVEIDPDAKDKKELVRMGPTVTTIKTPSSLDSTAPESLRASSKAPSIGSSKTFEIESTLNAFPTESLISSSKTLSRKGSTVPSIRSKSPSRTGSTVPSIRSKSPSLTGSALNRLGTEALLSSLRASSQIESTAPSKVSSKAPSRIRSTLYGLPTETLEGSSKASSQKGSTVPSKRSSKASTLTGSTRIEIPAETFLRSSVGSFKAPSRIGSTLYGIPTETLNSSPKAPSRVDSTAPSIVSSRAPSRIGSPLYGIPTESLKGASKASSRIGSTVTLLRSEAQSRRGSNPNEPPTETTVVKYTKHSAKGSMGPKLNTNSTKIPIVKYPMKPTRSSILSSRIESILTTKDPNTKALSRIKNETQRSNVQGDNDLLVNRYLKKTNQKDWPRKNSVYCCNCCCKGLTDRSEVKANERRQRSLSNLRISKSKQQQEPQKAEKALAMIKSKSKSKRKVKRKIIVSQPAPKTDEGNDLWFDCNVPMRLSIPTAICLGSPWDILSFIPNIMKTNNSELKALPASDSNNKILAKSGRNLPSPKTPEILEDTKRKFCITVFPMGYRPSVPQSTEEPEIEKPPPVEPKLPKKKKMNSKKKDKSKLRDLPPRKGSKDISISGDMPNNKPGNDTTRKESESSLSSEDRYMSNDREQSVNRRNSRDRDSGDYSLRKGSKNEPLSYDMDISNSRKYSYRKGSENCSIYDDEGDLSSCRCCKSCNQDYSSRKEYKDYLINGNMANTKARDYSSQKGLEDYINRKDKPREYASPDGPEDYSMKYNMAQTKRCRFSDQEQCQQLFTEGDLTIDPIREDTWNRNSPRREPENYPSNDDKPFRRNCQCSTTQTPDDDDNNGCFCTPDDWEDRSYKRVFNDSARVKGCQCNFEKNREIPLESRKTIDNKTEDFRKELDDIFSPLSCQCDDTINPDNGEDNSRSFKSTGPNLVSPRGSNDNIYPEVCQCNSEENQEPSPKSRKLIDGENKDSRKESAGKDSQKESKFEPLPLPVPTQKGPTQRSMTTNKVPKRRIPDVPIKDKVPIQKRPSSPSRSGNTVPKKKSPDVPFKDPVPTPKRSTSPSRSGNTVLKKKIPDVPLNEPTKRTRSSESPVSRKPGIFQKNVNPSSKRTSPDMTKSAITKASSAMSIFPRTVSQTAVKPKHSKKISIVDHLSVHSGLISARPKKNLDESSIYSYRTSKRSVSDESLVKKIINNMTDSSSDSTNVESRRPSDKSIDSSGSIGTIFSKYGSRRATEFTDSSNESVAVFQLPKNSDANVKDRNSGGRSKSEMEGNILEHFMKMFSEHTENLKESIKQLVDKSTYVRTIDKNKTKHNKYESSKQPSKATEFEQYQGRSVESKTIQNIISAMPPNSKNRLIELLKHENSDSFKRTIKESQRTSDLIKDTRLQWLIENKSQLFQLLSSLSPPQSKSQHTDTHNSSLSQPNHDQFPTIIHDLKLSSGLQKDFDQNNLPKTDHAEATRDTTKKKRHHYNNENECDKKQDNYISNAKDFKICLLRQKTDNSPAVLEEYNVAAFTRRLSSHPLQEGGAESKLNCECKRMSGERNMEKLHSINEDNVETIWRDLKRFCQKSNAKYDDVLQKPVVLVPFRPDSEDTAQMMGMCKPDEWKELKLPRKKSSKNRFIQRPHSVQSNCLPFINLRAYKRDQPKESMRREYFNGSNVAPSSSQSKSNVCKCPLKNKSKLFEYLRKNRISNRSECPKSESSQTDARQKTNRGGSQCEISERKLGPKVKATSRLLKQQYSKAKVQRSSDRASEQSERINHPKYEFQVSPTDNIVSNRSNSLKLHSAHTDKRIKEVGKEFEKSDSSYFCNAKAKVPFRGYDDRKKSKKLTQSEHSNKSYRPSRSKSPMSRSSLVERKKSDYRNESKVSKRSNRSNAEQQESPRKRNRSVSPKPKSSFRKLAYPQVERKKSDNRNESKIPERSYRSKAEPQESTRKGNRSVSPKPKGSYRIVSIPKVERKKSDNRNESKIPERSYRSKAEPQESTRKRDRSESPKPKRSNRPKAEFSRQSVSPIRSKSPKPRSDSQTDEQLNASELIYQQEDQFQEDQSSDDVRKSAANHDIVTHLGPRLFRRGSKDLRHQEEFSENAISLEAKDPFSGQPIGQEKIEDLRGTESHTQSSESCVDYCNCSTNMTRDLHQQQQMQLHQHLQRANNEFDRRQQQHLNEYRGTQFGTIRREEAELICCCGYSEQQLQQRQKQRQQRQEQQQHILQQQIEQQRQILQQQQIQQQEYIKMQHIQHIQQQQQRQQQMQQQQSQQEEENCCCFSYSRDLSQQQWTPQQQQHAQLFEKRKALNAQQQEEQLQMLRQLQYVQQVEQIEQQKYIKQQAQRQQYSQQQQQRGNLLDNQASSPARQQQLQQQESNSFTNYWQISQQQQQQARMIRLPENNRQNEAFFNTTNGFVASHQQQQQQLPYFPCCYCHIAPEPDLTDISSSFYQQTLQKYGVQRLPEEYIPETVCCLPCCACCSYAYGRQQQRQQPQ